MILEIPLGTLCGYEVCRTLKADLGPELVVIFLSGARTETYDRVAGLLMGADDYVTKPSAPDEVLARLRIATRRAAPAPAFAASGRLTRREHEVLNLLAEGLKWVQIAERLVISPKTVATHVEQHPAQAGRHQPRRGDRGRLPRSAAGPAGPVSGSSTLDSSSDRGRLARARRGGAERRRSPSGPSSPAARMMKPMPLSSSARPMTIAKRPTLRGEERGVERRVRAVSLIHTWRAGLSAAAPVLGSLSGLGGDVGALAVGGGVLGHLGVGLAAGRLERVDAHVARQSTSPRRRW